MIVEAILLPMLGRGVSKGKAFTADVKGFADFRVRKAKIPFHAGLVFSDGLATGPLAETQSALKSCGSQYRAISVRGTGIPD